VRDFMRRTRTCSYRCTATSPRPTANARGCTAGLILTTDDVKSCHHASVEVRLRYAGASVSVGSLPRGALRPDASDRKLGLWAGPGLSIYFAANPGLWLRLVIPRGSPCAPHVATGEKSRSVAWSVRRPSYGREAAECVSGAASFQALTSRALPEGPSNALAEGCVSGSFDHTCAYTGALQIRAVPVGSS
jgi:hypothetical protein